jgi:putative spermidine/putrescine transport system substrate-binding protein
MAKQARQEKVLTIAGDPTSVPALDELAQGFHDAFGVTVKWVLPEMTTAQRFEAVKGGRSAADRPDVFALDPGDVVTAADPVTAYRVADFDDRIPEEQRDPNGLWVHDFGGAMAVGYNATVLGKGLGARVLDSRLASGGLALAGSPAYSASAAHALIMLDDLAGAQPGSASGLSLLEHQKLARGYEDLGKLSNGEQTVLLDWTYAQTAVRSALKKKHITWDFKIPENAEVTGWHGIAISATAPHPAAARLWEEFLFYASSQNYVMGTGAMPTTYRYLMRSSQLSRKSRLAMPVLVAEPQVPSQPTIAAVRAAANRWNQLHSGG